MKKSGGFSLVELMIGLALGLLLTIGILRIFVSSKQGYRVQESSSRMQENMRYALDAIGKEVRHADFWGGVKTGNVVRDTALGAGGVACSESWYSDVSGGLVGYQGAATEAALGMAGCTKSPYIVGSDVIAFRYADPNATYAQPGGVAAAATAATADGRYPGLYLRTLVGRTGYLFPPTAIGAARTATSSDDVEATGAFEYRFRASVLSLGVFTPTEDSALPANKRRRIPTLYICSIDRSCGFGGNPEPLVEGIEQMQFEYGIDTNNDRVADRFQNAADVTTAGAWARVISVKVGLVVRGDALDDFTDTTTYQLPGNFPYTPADDAATLVDERSFQRRVIVREFQVRNRVRS